MFHLHSLSENCSNVSLAGPLSLGLIKGSFVLLGCVNLVLNCLCFFVFLCHKQRDSTVRLLLLILSFNEMMTSFGMTSVETVRILLEVVGSRIRYPSAQVPRGIVNFLTITWVMANAFIIARNWSVVLIAVSRCEAVLRPFSRNTGRFFGHRTLVATSAVIVLLGLASAVPKAFQEGFNFCEDTGRIFAKNDLKPFEYYSEFYVVTMFLQAVLPVAIVAVASVAMTIGLRRSRGRSDQLNERGGGGAGTSGVGFSGASAQHSKATRTIQILLIAFVCMETPMFLFVLIGTRVEEGNPFWDAAVTYAIGIANLCVNLDSTCNFIIYMTTNSMFRSAVLQRRCCRRRDQSQDPDRLLSGWATTRRPNWRPAESSRRRSDCVGIGRNGAAEPALKATPQPRLATMPEEPSEPPAQPLLSDDLVTRV